VRARELVADLVDHLFRGGAAHFGLRAGTEPLRHLQAHLDDAVAFRRGESLSVRVGADELDAVESRDDHVVDGVAAGAADPEHRDVWLEFPDVRSLQIDCHDCFALSWPSCPRGAGQRVLHVDSRRRPPRRRPHIQKLSRIQRPNLEK
jgi:hypothetical protein